MKDSRKPEKVLTIAGSDSGGAAGLQADLRTFAALGVYGMSAITAVTAQNSLAVTVVHFLPPALLRAQLDAVLTDYGAAAVKTGFIGKAELVAEAAAALAEHGCRQIVVDPVLVNHRGEAMFPAEVRRQYVRRLLPQAALVTPNRHEAALLLGLPAPPPARLGRLAEMAQALHQFGPRCVYLKGGQQQGQRIDLFSDGQQVRRLSAPAVETEHTHGAGDTLSAAAAALLAKGADMETAVAQAHAFTAAAVRRGARWQMGGGHGPVWPLSHLI